MEAILFLAWLILAVEYWDQRRQIKRDRRMLEHKAWLAKKWEGNAKLWQSLYESVNGRYCAASDAPDKQREGQI